VVNDESHNSSSSLRVFGLPCPIPDDPADLKNWRDQRFTTSKNQLL
jgi:hypothetical protein